MAVNGDHLETLPKESEPLALRIEHAGESKAGGRPYNDDAFFIPSRMSYLLASSGSLEEQEKKQAEVLSEMLKGLVLTHQDEPTEKLQITIEEILSLPKRAQKLIDEGKIKGLMIGTDGMGGRESGDVASTVATLIVADYLIRFVESFEDPVFDSQVLTEAILRADMVLRALNEREKKRMGTTMVLALVDKGDQAHIANVGDSRIYRFNAQAKKIDLLTKDQSAAWVALTFLGSFPPSAIFTYEYRGELERHLGGQGLAADKVQSALVKLNPGDSLMGCSDGVWEGVNVESQMVKSILERIDQQYEQETERTIGALSEMPEEERKEVTGQLRAEAAKRAFGRILLEIACQGINPWQASPRRLVEHFTSPQLTDFSRDNAFSIVVKAIG
jgi:serine/threonine protein phosphatase PrpC